MVFVLLDLALTLVLVLSLFCFGSCLNRIGLQISTISAPVFFSMLFLFCSLSLGIVCWIFGLEVMG